VLCVNTGPVQHRIVCDNSEIKLSCPIGRTLHIHSGFYGRTSDAVCNTTSDKASLALSRGVKCRRDVSLQLRERCEQRADCATMVSPLVFRSPVGKACQSAPKYLAVAFSCDGMLALTRICLMLL